MPSTALHIELSKAFDLEPFTYGHFAPISVIDKNGGKRKLSKRKDNEADVEYWLQAGYPVEAVKAYLLGLANSNFEDWYRNHSSEPIENYPVSLEKLAASRAPLLDMRKLDDYAKDYIAAQPQPVFNEKILAWAKENSPRFALAAEVDMDYTNNVFSIERDGDKPRKDLAKWSDAPDQYSYFFDNLYPEEFAGRVAEELKDLPAETIQKVCETFLQDYDPADSAEIWLEKLRKGAESTGLHMRDYARILRVKLTGKNRTPDLYAIMQVMGQDRVRSRLV